MSHTLNPEFNSEVIVQHTIEILGDLVPYLEEAAKLVNKHAHSLDKSFVDEVSELDRRLAYSFLRMKNKYQAKEKINEN